MLEKGFTAGAKSMFSGLAEGAVGMLGNKAGEIGLGAAAGALTGMGIHATTGIAGAIGGVAGMTNSSGSFGGMVGAGIRGGMAGGAIAAGATSKMFGGGISKAFQSMGMLAPKNAGQLGGAMKTSAFKNASGGFGMNMSQATVGLSLMKGAKGAPQGMIDRGKAAYNTVKNQDWTGRATSAATLGGVGFAAYSSNAMGLGVPGNYGYR